MAKNKAELRGMEKMLKKLNREIKAIKNRSLRGLIEAQIIVRRDMEFTPPLVPIDTGNLRASWFTVTSKNEIVEGRAVSFVRDLLGKLKAGHLSSILNAKSKLSNVKQPSLIMGFSAYYALFVHEMIGATFQRPNAGAHFFLSSLNRNNKRIRNVIAKYAKIKK